MMKNKKPVNIIILAVIIALAALIIIFDAAYIILVNRLDKLDNELGDVSKKISDSLVTPKGEDTLPPQETLAPAETYYCLGKENVYIYADSDLHSAIEGMISPGMKAEVIGEGDEFYLCTLKGGKTGYIEKKYLGKNVSLIAPANAPDAVDLRLYIPEMEFDILLATPANITGHALYPPIPLMERHTADMLKAANDIFMEDGYVIKVYDAYRPKSAQYELYNLVGDNRFVADPYTTNSWHQLGRAIDMSLVNIQTGQELEMPTPMHTLNESSARYSENQWSQTAKENVDYMTKVMTSCGFKTLVTEWWHFENNADGATLPIDIDLSALEYGAN